MDSGVAVLIVGLLLTGVALYYVKARTALEERTWTFSDALDEFRQVVELVGKFAPAADQLVKLGEMKPAQRRQAVINMVVRVMPNVDPKLVGWIVENWVVVEQPELKSKLRSLAGGQE